ATNATVAVDTGSLNLSGAVGQSTTGLGLTKTGAGILTFSGAAANTYTGPTTVSTGELDLAKTAGTNAVPAALTINGGILKLLAAIGGTGGLTKAGPGILTLSGTGANTYTGATTVNESELDLAKTAGTNAIAGPLVVGDGTGGTDVDKVVLVNNTQIADTAAVTITHSGVLDLATDATSDTIGPLTLTGGHVTTGTGVLTLGNNVTTNTDPATS